MNLIPNVKSRITAFRCSNQASAVFLGNRSTAAAAPSHLSPAPGKAAGHEPFRQVRRMVCCVMISEHRPEGRAMLWRALLVVAGRTQLLY